jgi:hypothetical protein
MIRPLLAAAAMLAGIGLATPSSADEPGIQADCAASWAAERGTGFAIVCAAPQLRALWNEAAIYESYLGALLDGPQWRSLPDLTPAKLVEACGAALPAPAAMIDCYAEQFRQHNAGLLALLRMYTQPKLRS